MPSLQRRLSPKERDRIAKKVKVSPRTVQRVIEGGPNVSQGTRNSVIVELEREGYGRMPEAVVGLVIPDLKNPFFVSLADSLESLLAKQSMQLVLATSDNYEARENLHIRWMIGMRASGVFYCQNPPFEESLHTLTTAPNLAVVLIDTERPGLDTVLTDNAAGIERAVTHLAIENRHERIGFLAGPEGSSTAKAREVAFEQAMAAHGLSDGYVIHLSGDYTFESGKDAALELAKRKRRGQEMPTAIVSANDLMAIGLIKGLEEISSGVPGLSVPDQISVVGFDDIPTSTMITPELTSIDQRVEEIAERAVRLIVRRIDAIEKGEDLAAVVQQVPPKFKPRQSVNPPPSPADG